MFGMKKVSLSKQLFIVLLIGAIATVSFAPTAHAFEQKKWFVPDHGWWYINSYYVYWEIMWDKKPCSWPWECLDFECKPPVTAFRYDGGTIYSNLPAWKPNIDQPDENPDYNDISVLCTRPDLIATGVWYYIQIPIDTLSGFVGAKIWLEVEYSQFYYFPPRQYEYFETWIRSTSPYATEGEYEQVFDQTKPANVNRKAYRSMYMYGMVIGTNYATVTLTAYNADQTYARCVDIQINGHYMRVISWINPGETKSAYVSIPREWVIIGGYNSIYAWITTYDQYDGGNSWVTLTLKVSNPSHTESRAGTW